ncbi:hypothetical protein BU15DRAFT_64822 [Melanogaster broomeanus]|nr:hypothetical protein BU15DRAFT_64822 [Melanogaster broomeanus]
MKFFSPLVLAGLFASSIAAPVGNGIIINLRDLEANESQLNKRDIITYSYSGLLFGPSPPASAMSAPVRLTPTKAVGLEAQGVPQDQFSQYLSQALQVTDPGNWK